MRKAPRQYVRQMPKIYGSVEKPRRDFSSVIRFFKRLFGAILIVGCIYFFFFGPFFRVRTVEVEGAVLTSSTQFSDLVPRGGSLWLFSENSIIQKVLENPLVLSAEVFRGIPSTVRLVIQERTPAVAWYTGTTVVLLDADGFAFQAFTPDKLPSASSVPGKTIAAIPHVYDTKALPVALNGQTASATFVHFVDVTQTQLKEYLPTLDFNRIEITDSTYDVTFVSTQGMRVQMNSLGDAGVQVRNLTRLVHQQKVTATSQVDLRIDRWAYVK
jgi:hypothetical protein